MSPVLQSSRDACAICRLPIARLLSQIAPFQCLDARSWSHVVDPFPLPYLSTPGALREASEGGVGEGRGRWDSGQRLLVSPRSGAAHQSPRAMEGYAGHQGPRGQPISAAEAERTPPRYRPGPWRYNTRVALAIVPSMLMLAGAGGGMLLGTLLVGLMISYILDVLKMAEVGGRAGGATSALHVSPRRSTAPACHAIIGSPSDVRWTRARLLSDSRRAPFRSLLPFLLNRARSCRCGRRSWASTSPC